MNAREYTRVQSIDVAATILLLIFIVVMDRLVVYLDRHMGGSAVTWGLVGFGCFVLASVAGVLLCGAAARGDRMAAEARRLRDHG